jgi:hypothetical protein
MLLYARVHGCGAMIKGDRESSLAVGSTYLINKFGSEEILGSYRLTKVEIEGEYGLKLTFSGAGGDWVIKSDELVRYQFKNLW